MCSRHGEGVSGLCIVQALLLWQLSARATVQTSIGLWGACAYQSTFARPLQAYTVEKMREHLGDLANEAALMLLFLRNVERLEVLRWAPGTPEPLLLHECGVQVRRTFASGHLMPS